MLKLHVHVFYSFQYWGSLYPLAENELIENEVLVPFDFGVVYIKRIIDKRNYNKFQSPSILGWSISCLENGQVWVKCFSPLRYWGGLYPFDNLKRDEYVVLVPFDIGVVYILLIILKEMNMQFQSPSILGQSISFQFLHSILRQFQSPSILGQSISKKQHYTDKNKCFSPLRYWGSLYL